MVTFRRRKKDDRWNLQITLHSTTNTKLLKLKVNFNEANPRQIISGIAGYFPNEKDLVGKKCMFVTNLEPRIIRGFESQGMILALSSDEGKFSLLEPNDEIPAGTRAK